MNPPFFTHKLVAVLNEKLETGVAMNALAHTSIVLGSRIEKEKLRVANYADADGKVHLSSEIPFIILKGNATKLRELSRQARERQGEGKLDFVDFVHTMTGGTYIEQIENSRKTKEEDLTYYGIVLFGEWDELSQMTKKFSLFK